ncbi:MAG TPA: NAD(+)/NADH kinase [Jiangellales bacterium]|nr:NAD(+)/NADH kinase [Jiangellales bacterium]
MNTSPTIGFLVNPVAGVGGPAGLAGSDGADVQRRARDRGGEPRAAARAAAALAELARHTGVEILTAPAAMGADVVHAQRLPHRTLDVPLPAVTSGTDTTTCARYLADAAVDLLLFAGGDGTAADVAAGVGHRVPVLGIPAGVKMYSGCFAVSPQAAGRTAAHYLSRAAGRAMPVEVVDLDEQALREGHARPRLTASLVVPIAPAVQQRKAPTEVDLRCQAEQAAWAAAALVDSDLVTAVGPGGTMAALLARRGLPASLLGVDVIDRQGLIAADVSEPQLFEIVTNRPTQIVVTVIGGQGFLFGRGNQQFSPRVIRAVGAEGIVVVAPELKLAALAGRPLLVDTGDVDTDRLLTGPRRIITGVSSWAIYPVGSAADLSRRTERSGWYS